MQRHVQQIIVWKQIFHNDPIPLKNLMAELINMEIAGVKISITSKEHISLHDNGPASFSFCSDDHLNKKKPDISIQIEKGKRPDTNKCDQIFTSGQTWSMFRDSHGYFISLHPHSFKEPIWVAKTNKDFSSIDIYYHRETTDGENENRVITNPVNYPLDQILLMHFLATRDGVLIHSAGADIDGKGCIFPGKSGAGKSTLSRQFVQPGMAKLLSDDRMIIRKTEKGYRAYGTPWPGDAGIAENKEVPLLGIFFIKHGNDNRIREISPKEAIERFFSVTSIPWYDKEMMQLALTTLEELAFNIPSYEFSFKPHPDAADTLRQFVSKQ